jgi:hypothetical protein
MTGVLTIQPHRGRNQQFVDFMVNEGFDKAADAPGTLFRGGRSMIKSQHLFEPAPDHFYLWFVKADELVTDEKTFSNVLDAMLDMCRPGLEAIASVSGVRLYVVRGSFDAGPRSAIGARLGKEERGCFF